MKHVRRFLLHRSLAGLILLLALAGGCGLTSAGINLGSGKTDAIYDPPPGSVAFRRLHLEKTESVVVLSIEGDDVRGSMLKIYRTMLDKGYSVRDIDNTILILKRANLVGKKSTTPEYIKKASGIFKEQIAVAGKVEVIQADPLRVLVILNLIDLKKQKILWTAKLSYSGRYLGVGNPFERAVNESVQKSLSVLPRANP
jgi:hypothetical protein